MSKIVSFGEIMLRLNPEGYRRLVQADRLEASYAGGEANVAVSLANYGHESVYVTKLPDNEIGQSAVNGLRRYGVDTSKIVRGGERIGIYFVEKGASQRASKVIYDRVGSAIAKASREDFNWETILEGADWFHFTGITPALSEGLSDICLQACKEAKKRGLTVSCDLNYRKKLWSEAQACKVMTEIMPYVDVCIANEEDAASVFGICAQETDIMSGALSREGYRKVAEQLTEKFHFQMVAITLRGSISATDNKWSGMLYTEDQAYFSKEYSIHIVDRVGGGDSFGGALIHSVLAGKKPQEAIEFAVAASCLKHTIEQDFNLVTEKEVNALAEGNGSGRVQR